MALGAALAVAGLLQLSPCTAGLIVEADAMAAIVLRIAQRCCTACSKECKRYPLSAKPQEHAVELKLLHACRCSQIWRRGLLLYAESGSELQHRQDVVEDKATLGVKQR